MAITASISESEVFIVTRYVTCAIRYVSCSESEVFIDTRYVTCDIRYVSCDNSEAFIVVSYLTSNESEIVWVNSSVVQGIHHALSLHLIVSSS